MRLPNMHPVARSRWSGWLLAAAITLESLWIALLTVLVVMR